MLFIKNFFLLLLFAFSFNSFLKAQICKKTSYTIYLGTTHSSKNIFDTTISKSQELGLKGVVSLYSIGKHKDLNLFYLKFVNAEPLSANINKDTFNKRNNYLLKGIYFTQKNNGEIIGYKNVDTSILFSKNTFIKIIGFLSHINLDTTAEIYTSDGLFKAKYSIDSNLNNNYDVCLKEMEKMQNIDNSIIKKHFKYYASGCYAYKSNALKNINLSIARETKLNFKIMSKTLDTFSLTYINETLEGYKINKEIYFELLKNAAVAIQNELLLQMINAQKTIPLTECLSYLELIDSIKDEKFNNVLMESICNYVHYKKDTFNKFEKLFIESNPSSKKFDILKVAIMNLKNDRFALVFNNYFKQPDFSKVAFFKCLPNISFMQNPPTTVVENLFVILNRNDFNKEEKEKVLLAISNLVFEMNKNNNDAFYFNKLMVFANFQVLDSLLTIAILGNTGNKINLVNYYDIRQLNDGFLEAAALYSLRLVKDDDVAQIYKHYISNTNNEITLRSIYNALVIAQPNYELIRAISSRLNLNNLSEDNMVVLVKILYNWSFYSQKAINEILKIYENTMNSFLKGLLLKYIKIIKQ